MPTRTRKPRRVTIERGCLTGVGTTAALAKADLEARVDGALAGSYEPTLVTCGRYTAVVYRQPEGWCYRVQSLDTIEVQGVHAVGPGCAYGSLAEASGMAAFHVLDLGSDIDAFHADADIPAWLASPGHRANLLGNARFRRAYAYAKANRPDGADDDHRWHAWACDHSRDERFA